jgi:hypothetical protein
MLTVRPELVGMDGAGGDERRALHYAVMRRSAPMVKLLMEAGADAQGSGLKRIEWALAAADSGCGDADRFTRHYEFHATVALAATRVVV